MFGLLGGIIGRFAFKALGWSTAWGFIFGEAIFNWIFGNRNTPSDTPSLDEFSVQRSEYGLPINIVYGAPRVAGNVIGHVDVLKRPQRERVGGIRTPLFTIGGKLVTVGWKYYGTWMSAICETDPNGDGVDGFDQIYANGELIFDISETAEETLKNESLAMLANGTITFYLGGKNQPVNTIAANLAQGITPIYAHLAYIQFNRFEFFGSIPNIEARVIRTGDLVGRRWVTRTPVQMPSRFSHATYAVGRDLYLAGGLNDQATLQDFWKFNLRDGWIQLNSMDIARDSFTLTPFVEDSGKIFLIVAGGIDDTFNPLTALKQYDISNGSWSDIPDPSPDTPFPLSNHAAAFFQSTNNGKGIFLTCGDKGVGGFSESLWFSGNKGGTWQELNETCGLGTRIDHFMIVFKDDLYAGGGAYQAGGGDTSPSRKIYKYNDIAGGGAFGQIAIKVTDRNGTLHEDGMFPVPNQELWGCTVWADNLIVFGREGSEMRIFKSEDTENWFEITDTFQPGLGDFKDFGGSPAYASFNTVSELMLVVGGAKGAISNPIASVRVSNPPTAYPDDISLYSIVIDLFNRCGILETEVYAEELIDRIRAYTIRQQGGANGPIGQLMAAYFWDIVQDNVLRCNKRGADYRPINTSIQETDLGAKPDSGRFEQSLVQTWQPAQELPQTVNVHYFDQDTREEKNLQTAPRELAGTNRTINLTVPIVMKANEAQKIAEITLADLWAERLPGATNLTTQHIDLLPTDVIQFPYEGAIKTHRIIQQVIGDNAIIELDNVSEEPSLYSRNAAGDGGTVGGTPDRKETYDVFGFLLDIPALHEHHIFDYGVYGVATIDDPNETLYSGVDVYFSRDGGTTYEIGGDITYPATLGLMDTILGDGSAGTWDRANKFTVTLKNGALTSSTESAVLNGENLCWIGDPENTGAGELLQFVNATLISGTTYEIDTLLRGVYGTESATGTHQSGESFALIEVQERVLFDQGDLMRPMKYKLVSPGRTHTEVTDFSNFTFQAESLKPLSPSAVTGVKLLNGNWRVEWVRRVRGGDYSISQEPPLFEEQEKYQLDYLNDSGEIIHHKEILVFSIKAGKKPFHEFNPVTEIYFEDRDSISFRLYQISAFLPGEGKGKGEKHTFTI